MAKENNILGVEKLLLGAPGDGVMGIDLTEFNDIEVGSITFEGSQANETTIPTEANDAYITVDDTADPTTLTARLFGVSAENRVMLMGGDVGPAALATPSNVTFADAAGTLPAATYYYRVSAVNEFGETLASAETSHVLGAEGGVQIYWDAVTGAKGYKIYGRDTGAELFIASVGEVTTYTDDGSITPSGALPATNTTGSEEGNYLAPSSKTNIYLSAKLEAKEVNGKRGIVKIPYGKISAREQGTITKNGLPAVDVTITANTPESSAGIEGRPYIVGWEEVV